MILLDIDLASASPKEPSELESVLACLGDDASALRHKNPACEIAANLEAAADLLAKFESLLLLSVSAYLASPSEISQAIRQTLGMGKFEGLDSGQMVRAKLALNHRLDVAAENAKPAIAKTPHSL